MSKHTERPVRYPASEAYIVIQHFMWDRLKLKGTELMIYAIIHGFSQDGKSMFRGSANYLATCCGISEDTVYRQLDRLVQNKLIWKEVIPTAKNNSKCHYCYYWTVESRTNPIKHKRKKEEQNSQRQA